MNMYIKDNNELDTNTSIGADTLVSRKAVIVLERTSLQEKDITLYRSRKSKGVTTYWVLLSEDNEIQEWVNDNPNVGDKIFKHVSDNPQAQKTMRAGLKEELDAREILVKTYDEEIANTERVFNFVVGSALREAQTLNMPGHPQEVSRNDFLLEGSHWDYDEDAYDEARKAYSIVNDAYVKAYCDLREQSQINGITVADVVLYGIARTHRVIIKGFGEAWVLGRGDAVGMVKCVRVKPDNSIGLGFQVEAHTQCYAAKHSGIYTTLEDRHLDEGIPNRYTMQIHLPAEDEKYSVYRVSIDVELNWYVVTDYQDTKSVAVYEPKFHIGIPSIRMNELEHIHNLTEGLKIAHTVAWTWMRQEKITISEDY